MCVQTEIALTGQYQGAVYRITQDYFAAEEAAYDHDADATANASRSGGYDRTQYGYNQSMEGDSTVRY